MTDASTHTTGAPAYCLEGATLFNPRKRTLNRDSNEIALRENESLLLTLLLDGQQHKQQLMEAIWGSRGVIVSESNYYKVIRGLRNAFSDIGLDPELIKTIPRVGVCYAGQFETCSTPALPVLVIPNPPIKRFQLDAQSVVIALLLLLLLTSAAIWHWPRTSTAKWDYVRIGNTEQFTVYARAKHQVALDEVIANYQRFNKRSPYRYLYYTNIGNSYTILACKKDEISPECVTLAYKIV